MILMGHMHVDLFNQSLGGKTEVMTFMAAEEVIKFNWGILLELCPRMTVMFSQRHISNCI